MKIKFKKIHADAKIPVAATPEAGAYDLVCTEVEVHENYTSCKLGFATEIPEGWRGVCVARSSVSKTGWMLANGIGIIDSDYRGEWEVRFVAVPKDVTTDEIGTYYSSTLDTLPFPYRVGDRVAQVYFEQVEQVTFTEQELSPSQREGGFGSTGR